MISPPLEQSFFAILLGYGVGDDYEQYRNRTLEQTGRGTERIIVLGNTPFENVDIDRLGNRLDKSVTEQVLYFKSGIEHVSDIHKKKDHESRLDAGKRYISDLMQSVCAVYRCGLVKVRVDRGNCGQIDDRVPSRFLPAVGKSDYAPEVFGKCEKVDSLFNKSESKQQVIYYT